MQVVISSYLPAKVVIYRRAHKLTSCHADGNLADSFLCAPCAPSDFAKYEYFGVSSRSPPLFACTRYVDNKDMCDYTNGLGIDTIIKVRTCTNVENLSTSIVA